MPVQNLKKMLWTNVQALMDRRYGGEALGRFARDCGLGQASMTRIKAQETAVGIDVIEKIAAGFRLEPWQVLAPGLGAALYVIDDKRVVPVYSPNEPAPAGPRATSFEAWLASKPAGYRASCGPSASVAEWLACVDDYRHNR